MYSFKETAAQRPATRRINHVECLHGMEVPDPYRWLEDVDSPEIKTWIRAQNEHTQAVLGTIPFKNGLRRRVEALAAFEGVELPKHAGNRLFFKLQASSERQPSLVWMEKGIDEIHSLLDPATLAEDAAVSVVGFEPSPSGRYVAYGLSEAGSDWQTWFVMDVDSGERLDDELTWIRFTIASWREDESGFFYTGSDAPPEGEMYKAPATKRTI